MPPGWNVPLTVLVSVSCAWAEATAGAMTAAKAAARSVRQDINRHPSLDRDLTRSIGSPCRRLGEMSGGGSATIATARIVVC